MSDPNACAVAGAVAVAGVKAAIGKKEEGAEAEAVKLDAVVVVEAQLLMALQRMLHRPVTVRLLISPGESKEMWHNTTSPGV